jgi:hypothetical protein
MLFYFACEAAGASSARHSLRPLNFRWLHTIQISRGSRGEIADVCCEYPPRHCEERTRRSNPAFLCVGSMDCFACARNDRTKLILRTPSCVQYIRLDGLHPSHLRGGWHIVSGANDVTGGGWCRRRGILRIICAAPHSALRATLPTKWEEKKERASLQQQVNSQLAAISERISARIVSISLRP